jgi:1-phosphofructokinase
VIRYESESAIGDGRVVVLAPTPLVTVTIERSSGGDEIHFHPGGQGVWIARLAVNLGAEVVLCGTFGGESGAIVKALLEPWGISVRAVPTAGWNGGYIHDRRSGEREPVAEMVGTDCSRHEIDELYGATLVAGFEADVVVLGGRELPQLSRERTPETFPLEIYTRLARDLRSNGIMTIGDLSGPMLAAAVDGGLDIVKVSDEELHLHGEIADRSSSAIWEAVDNLRERGAVSVVVTRAEQPTFAFLEGAHYEVHAPIVEPVDSRGAGDAVTAGVATALAQGRPLVEAVRIGTAAGTLNVTRHGLGSGSQQEIERLARHVEVRKREVR